FEGTDGEEILTGGLIRKIRANEGFTRLEFRRLLFRSNYDIAYTGAILTITKATLTVTADAKSKVYGENDPAFTYTVSGFEGTDRSEERRVGTKCRVGENVETYPNDQGHLEAGNKYDIA